MSQKTRFQDPNFLQWTLCARNAPFQKAVLLCEFVAAEGLNKGIQQAGPCPNCGGVDRFAIHFGKRQFNCRGCGVKGCNALSLALVGSKLSFIEACEELTGECAPHPTHREYNKKELPEKNALKKDLDKEMQPEISYQEKETKMKAESQRWAMSLWKQGKDWISTKAEEYFRARSIFPPEFGAQDLSGLGIKNIRFIPKLNYRHNEAVWAAPALLARIQDANAQFIGVQRIWIDPELSTQKGRPVWRCPETSILLPTKKILGSMQGGAIRLTNGIRWKEGAPSNNLENLILPHRLFVAEGIENLLSVYVSLRIMKPELIEGAAFWCAISISNLPLIQVPSCFSKVILITDGDAHKDKIARFLKRTEEALQAKGKDVQSIMPPRGYDFNDLLKGKDI